MVSFAWGRSDISVTSPTEQVPSVSSRDSPLPAPGFPLAPCQAVCLLFSLACRDPPPPHPPTRLLADMRPTAMAVVQPAVGKHWRGECGVGRGGICWAGWDAVTGNTWSFPLLAPYTTSPPPIRVNQSRATTLKLTFCFRLPRKLLNNIKNNVLPSHHPHRTSPRERERVYGCVLPLRSLTNDLTYTSLPRRMPDVQHK